MHTCVQIAQNAQMYVARECPHGILPSLFSALGFLFLFPGKMGNGVEMSVSSSLAMFLVQGVPTSICPRQQAVDPFPVLSGGILGLYWPR